MWHATIEGFRAVSRERRLVLVLWLFGLALSLAAVYPVWRALVLALGPLPGADVLVERFSVEVVADLVELRPGLLPGIGAAAASTFALGLLFGLVFAGGALEVLTASDARPFAHRFGRGAFRFFGRFLRLSAMVLPAAAIVAALVAGPLFALSGRLRRESGVEWMAHGASAAAILALGLVVLVALLVQDAARVRLVRSDQRRVRTALREGLGRVWRNKAAWLGAWSLNALALLAVFAAYLALAEALPAGAPWITLALLQQAFVIARGALRVALLGAEVALDAAQAPPLLADPQPASEELATGLA
jgi:hypothetical protein